MHTIYQTYMNTIVLLVIVSLYVHVQRGHPETSDSSEGAEVNGEEKKKKKKKKHKKHKSSETGSEVRATMCMCVNALGLLAND